MPQTTPTDRQPKAKDADGSHRFTIGNKTYTLPAISEEAASNVPGEVTYAAVMNPEDEGAQMRLAFATLEAAKPSKAALAALKSLPTKRMIEEVSAWMGGSSGSSD